MITVGMNYHIKDGKETAFESMFSLVLEKLSDTEGHVKTNLYRDAYETNSYLIVSEWATRAHFDSFVASDSFNKVTSWGESTILASAPKHEVYGAAAEPSVAKTSSNSAGGCPVQH